MSELPPILNAAVACRDSFRAATKVSRLMKQEWAENRLADFNLWTAGAGASTTGKASLDHRLQANQETHTIIVNLLCMLRILVEKCIKEAHKKEEKVSELSSRELTRMKHVEDSLNQLSRLTIAIRKAGTQSRLQKADSSFDSDNPQITSLRRHLELLLLIHPDKHGSSESIQKQLDTARLTPIQLRLIDANLKRRNRFLYAQRHAQKLENNSIKQGSMPSATGVLSKQKQPHSDTGKTATLSPPKEKILEDNPGAQSTTTATMVDEQILILPKAANPTTVVSVTSSRISYPKPPPIHEDQRVFTCPCCCQSLPTTLARGNHWKKHLMGDILPYTCILEECSLADIFYNTKGTWLNHMEKEHGGAEQWVCVACSQKGLNATFRESVDFTTHLEQEHSGIKKQQIPMLRSAWRRKIPFKVSNCPLCYFKGDDQNSVLDHVAEHIHSFSLRSLPWAPREGSEEDSDEEEYNGYFKQNPYFDVDSARSQISSPSGQSSFSTDIGSFAGSDYRKIESPTEQQKELTENPLGIVPLEMAMQADTNNWLSILGDWPMSVHELPKGYHNGPPFNDTKVLYEVTANNHKVQPTIIAKMRGKFFQREGYLTCYGQHFFSVSCSFTLHPYDPNAVYFVQTEQGQQERIRNFAMSISAKFNGFGSGTHDIIKDISKVGKNPEKVVLQPKYQHAAGMEFLYNSHTIQTSNKPTQHTFERVIFGRAIPSQIDQDAKQQYHRMVVELYAEVVDNKGQSRHLQIATRISDSIVARTSDSSYYDRPRTFQQFDPENFREALADLSDLDIQ